MHISQVLLVRYCEGREVNWAEGYAMLADHSWPHIRVREKNGTPVRWEVVVTGDWVKEKMHMEVGILAVLCIPVQIYMTKVEISNRLKHQIKSLSQTKIITHLICLCTDDPFLSFASFIGEIIVYIVFSREASGDSGLPSGEVGRHWRDLNS